MALERDAIRLLSDLVGPAHVLTDPDRCREFEVDWTGRFLGTTPAVVLPGSTDEVAAVVAWCREQRVALVPQGGNTGLVGGGAPLHGELVVSTRRLDAIGPVDVTSRQITAGAGATLAAVQAAAAAAGLRYPVDFGARASATVGGSIATNAGGMNLVRYGGTREQVVGIEAVLGTGAVVSHLGGLVKDNTGYHLPSLLCGSEGTLGIVTAARLRLVTRHEQHVAALVGFSSVADAVAAITAWRSELDALEAIELMLDEGIELVCRAFDLPRPLPDRWPAYVLVEVSAHDDPTDALATAVAAAPQVGDAAVATDALQRARLWRLREEHTLAIGTLGVPHKFDVTVPIPLLAEFLAEVPERVRRAWPAATTWLFGHAGDGNIHVNVTGVPDAGEDLDDAIYGYVAELGGSISAEHGVGHAKARWLHLCRSAAEIEAMRAIKRALDPDGIMNPGAVLPS